MNSFDKREKAEEAKFARDSELLFRMAARRNRLLGLWAAEKLGMSGEDAKAYSSECVESDFTVPGEEDVYEKVMNDLTNADAGVTEHDLRHRMAALMDAAREQIEGESKD